MSLVEQSIVYKSGNRQIDGYLVRPEGDGLFPGIVVIHEAFGLNENIKDVTRRFATIGYMALAVDLFSGRNAAICMFRLVGGMQFNSLNHEGIRDLKAGLSFLLEQPGLDHEHVGAIGFCMGGSLAIAWASADNRLKAIAPFYGMNPRPLKAVERMCPVVGSYPDKDFTTAHGKKLDVELDRYNISHDIKIYPDSKHSFFNDKGRAYNAVAAEDTWTRIQSFFKEHVEVKTPVE
ncbi:MAG TPA: dienelactone hydrolase family protein [Ktedonobacteraceae bacterium]|nr:dienelactone hydrolase family protein [Ktedonobacteraceae bacterium]